MLELNDSHIITTKWHTQCLLKHLSAHSNPCYKPEHIHLATSIVSQMKEIGYEVMEVKYVKISSLNKSNYSEAHVNLKALTDLFSLLI